MNRNKLSIRTAGLVLVVLLGLLLAGPAGARVSSYLQDPTVEPTVRPTATPAPYLELDPTSGVVGVAHEVKATGGLWAAGHQIQLFWDDTNHPIGPQTQIRGDGTFEINFTTPINMSPYSDAGIHRVIAIATDNTQAEASFELIPPSPTPTYTFTPIPPPSNTPTPTPLPPTKTPVTPTNTPTPTPSPTPSPTLHPITPMVTITPLPPTKAPTQVGTRAPTATRIPGTATNTRVPSATFTPSPTPGPGTPSATPLPTQVSAATVTPTPIQEIADTGSGWGTLLLWGVVLAGLVIAFRLLRVRGLGEQR